VATVTLSISCGTILDNMDKLNSGVERVLPPDGVLLAPQAASFTPGDTVFDILLRNAQSVDYTRTPSMGAYVRGIKGISEFDCGPLSGWTYRVNGVFPAVSVSDYKPKDGDRIEFLYTCALGRDLA
jgi:hypothetical protein